jgi:hypothetical protein
MTVYCEDCRWRTVDNGCDAPQNQVRIKTSSLVKRDRPGPRYGRRWLTLDRLRSFGWPADILFQACGKRGRWYVPLKKLFKP